VSRFWSPIVEKLTPYVPGEQPKGRTFIKLNTNENPYGPSPKAITAIKAATDDRLRLYPDPVAVDLRTAIGASYGLNPDHVFIGNGSDEVLSHAFNAFFTRKYPVLFADVTYAFYRTYCRLYGIRHRLMPLDNTYRIDPRHYRGLTGGMVVANPNAPTGIVQPLADIEQMLDRNPDVVVIVDEAYVDFGSESAVKMVGRYDNLLVIQTFSKSRSLAGMRVGFAIGQPHLIEALVRVKDSFNSYPIGQLALAGALAAWEDRKWFETTRKKVMAARDDTAEKLRGQGFDVLPSATNFLFASHSVIPAETILEQLRERGILVRHFNQERIRNWLRITVGTAEECASLLAATAEIVAK